jgi:hypothetical protein
MHLKCILKCQKNPSKKLWLLTCYMRTMSFRKKIKRLFYLCKKDNFDAKSKTFQMILFAFLHIP